MYCGSLLEVLYTSLVSVHTVLRHLDNWSHAVFHSTFKVLWYKYTFNEFFIPVQQQALGNRQLKIVPVRDPISFHDLQYCSTVSDFPYFL